MPKLGPDQRVQIVSNGTPTGTYVKVDGKRLTNVTGVRWSIDTHGFAECVIHLANVPCEVVGYT